MRQRFTIGIGLACRRIGCGLLSALVAGAGWAAESGTAPAPRHAIHQPAQPLGASLLAIARQTGVSLLFDPAAVEGLTAGPVSGQLSAGEAIAQALQGTGLVLNVQPDGSLVVRPKSASELRGGGAPGAASAPASAPSSTHGSDAVPMRLAQAASPGVSDAGPRAGTEPAPAPEVLEKVEVTGSRLRHVSGETALPVNVYTREDIEKSGQPTLERFLSGLNEVSVSQGEGSFSPATQGQGTVQLRGLPLGSTLVLVNGRRVEAVGSSSANFFNLSLIPLAAVDRVEIVPVGSSAVYGGDALAGVVNIILKKSIDGHTLSAQLGSGKGFGSGSLSMGMGDSNEFGSWMLLGFYSKATPLTTNDRAFFRDADYRRFGGPDARVQNCTPGNVSSTTTGNLPGLNASFAGIPVTAPGQTLTVQSFAATAGQANLCSGLTGNGATALVHGDESLGLHATGQHVLFGGLTGFGELTYAKDKVSTQGLGLNLDTVLVPETNPYNPFGVPVNVVARLGPDNGSEGYARHTDFVRALIGVRGDLSKRWDFETTASVSRDSGGRVLPNGNVDYDALTAALSSSDPSAALNPFTTGRAATDSVLRSIWSDSTRQNVGRKDILAAFARGPVVDLPAGSADAIVGVEWSRDVYDVLLPDEHIINSRKADAAYGELRLPLWRAGPEGALGWTGAALTVAGRRDRYSDFGSADTYQAGLELRPARTLLLRASAATSFKPPTLVQTNVDEFISPLEYAGLTDPARGNEPVTSGEWVRTTNKSLEPERGKAFALGMLWEPEASAGTRLGMTAWQVRINNLIGLLSSQVVLDNEALFPGWVTREPSVGGVPGRVTRVLWTESNFGFVDVRGVDFEASHSLKSRFGRWTFGASATRTSRYDVAITPGAPVEEHLGRRFDEFWAPTWKGRLSVGLDQSAWSLGITSRYLSAYNDIGTSTRTLGNTWLHDLSARLNLTRLGLSVGGVKAATLALSVVNVTNKLPQYADGSPYFDASQADWRGRYASARLSVDW